ncbi:MarR family winged helix-turn-helix transcriptional regulator [uncultured Aeromicrobium sp.]|uniref:MarR family winged helix-turn-helix transcriptional regulator n=1 Tax=uncultured Aeromicrobium sp. TaxID=337820 RepID=UPI0025E259CA|nr:MarR family transcriptional regulator [uncultured Aeromicrobium sp.]
MNTHLPSPDPRRYDVVRLVQELATASLRFTDRAGAARGLHRSDLNALQALARAREDGQAGLSARQLAEALSLSPSATTTLLDRLERAGHVTRGLDAKDRRRITVSMTDAAGSEAQAMFGPLAAALLEMMSEFDEEEVEVIARFLRAASDIIDEAGR